MNCILLLCVFFVSYGLCGWFRSNFNSSLSYIVNDNASIPINQTKLTQKQIMSTTWIFQQTPDVENTLTKRKGLFLMVLKWGKQRKSFCKPIDAATYEYAVALKIIQLLQNKWNTWRIPKRYKPLNAKNVSPECQKHSKGITRFVGLRDVA